MKSTSALNSLLSTVEPSLIHDGVGGEAKPESVLALADENGLEYAVIQSSNEINVDRVEVETRRQNLSNTIATIDQCACDTDVDYALIKDCNTVPHLPRDVDILINESDKETIIQSLVDSGCTVDQTGEIETAVISESGVSIDIYTRIQYFGQEFIDVDFLLENTRKRTVHETEYRGLSNEGEHLLHLVHSFFGHRRMTLLDFIHLKRIEQDGINESSCIQHAREMGWVSTYFYFRSHLSDIESKIQTGETITFPYLFELTVMIRSINKLDRDVMGHTPSILFSLWLDGIKLRIENTALEQAIKTVDPVRKLLLKIAYISRKNRGDRYS